MKIKYLVSFNLAYSVDETQDVIDNYKINVASNYVAGSKKRPNYSIYLNLTILIYYQ